MAIITDLAAVDAWLANGAEPATFQGVDLSARSDAFAEVNVANCVFLGCKLDARLAGQIAVEGAAVASEFPELPAQLPAFRPSLYTVADLYDGYAPDKSDSWIGTPDHAGHKWFNLDDNVRRPLSLSENVGARLHDTSQEQATSDFLHGRKVVAIMGGHDFKRVPDKGAPDVYWDCVRIARDLTRRGVLILTGGGPGLMEAGNLGALLADKPDRTLDEVRPLLTNEKFTSKAWLDTAARVRAHILGAWDAQPAPAAFSLGVPTWHYGHEPPNMFASHHSKMYFNSLREDGLVTLANNGIIYFEGNGGTVQEIFQDAAQNYYVGKGLSPTPMVFFNAGGYWDRSCADIPWPTSMDRRKPLLPLVRQLAMEKNFLSSILVTTDPARVVEFLMAFQPPTPVKADLRLRNV